MKFGSLVFAAIAALGGAAVGAAPLDKFVPPAVPSELAVYSNESAFLMAHAVGTQNYVCLPSGNTFAWTLFGPQATLFSEDGGQVITHFLSANPDEAGLPRATWQHSRDSSAVWAALSAMSTNAAYVDPNAIPWFLLRTVGKQTGPAAGDRLSQTSAIQRVNTSGGKAPDTGCTLATHVGRKALVPYEADYVFYQARQ